MQIILVQEEKFIILHLVKVNSQCLMTDKQSEELMYSQYFFQRVDLAILLLETLNCHLSKVL